MKFTKISFLFLLSTMFLTSCMNTDGNYDPSGGGVVEVAHSTLSGTTKFLDFAGYTVEPTYSSMASVEAQMKFKPSETQMAYVIYSYPQAGNENIHADKVVKTATLNYAVSVDAKIERVSEEGASNDSISTAPIRGLRSLMNEKQELYLHKGKCLMAGVDYYVLKQMHHLTLVYYPEKQVEGKVIFHLRHSGTKEADYVYNTSQQSFGMYPQLYIKTYNIAPYLLNVSHLEEYVVEVHTKVNENNNDLEKAEEKVYSLTCKKTTN